MRRATAVIFAYNHEPFIRQAVESALAQRVAGGYRVIVLEDCSTDRTSEILAQIETESPRRLEVVRAPSNECSNRRVAALLRQIQSEYVAFLDGDDYWTSPHKIQRQIDFLDQHPGHSMCFHDARVLHDDPSKPGHLHMAPDHPPTMTIDDMLRACVIAACTPVIRSEALRVLPSWYDDAEVGDWPLYLIAATRGDVGYLREVMAVYRVHDGGLWSGRSPDEKIGLLIRILESMNAHLGYAYDARIQTSLAYWRSQRAEAASCSS